MKIEIFNTYIAPSAKEVVGEVLDTTFISEGQIVKKFETQLQSELGLHQCVTLNSGTSALHLALVLAGIGPGDEVIVPAQTFVASGLVVVQVGAKVVFADVDYETGNISIESLKKKITPATKAIIPVHWGGYPCDMDEINAIAASQNIFVIEDAAHALGAIYNGKKIGSLDSHFTCFSFQAIKHLTTGDGGAIAINSTDKYKEAITRKWFGIDRDNAAVSELGERQYNIAMLGFKYHLNNYGAALGLANLSGFAKRMEERRAIALYYDNALKNVSGVKLFTYKKDRQSAYWLYGFHVENRRAFIQALKSKEITASVIHQRIDRNSIFGGMDHSLVNQKKFDESQIHIPIHDAVSMEQAEYIVETIKKGW